MNQRPILLPNPSFDKATFLRQMTPGSGRSNFQQSRYRHYRGSRPQTRRAQRPHRSRLDCYRKSRIPQPPHFRPNVKPSLLVKVLSYSRRRPYPRRYPKFLMMYVRHLSCALLTSVRSRYLLPLPSQNGAFSRPKYRLPVLGDYFTTEVTHILGACLFLWLTFVVVSGLAASLGYGAASEYLRRSTTSSPTDSTDPPSSLMMTEANLTRLVSKLTRMRGAALKVGQFLSIQGLRVPC